MGKKIKLDEIRAQSAMAEKVRNSQRFDDACKAIDERISKAARRGEFSVAYNLSDDERLISLNLVEEYSEFNAEIRHYLASGGPFDDHSYDYIVFFWRKDK